MNKKHVIGYAATAVIALGIGGAGNSTAAPVTVPGPERVVTKTVQGPERVVTKTVTKSSPKCIEALDLADEGFTIASQSMSAAGEGFTAAGNLDVAGINAAKVKIEATGGELGDLAPSYNMAKAACRATE